MWNCSTLLVTQALNYVLKAPIATTWAAGRDQLQTQLAAAAGALFWLLEMAKSRWQRGCPSSAPRRGSGCRSGAGDPGAPPRCCHRRGAPAAPTAIVPAAWRFPRSPLPRRGRKKCHERKVSANNAIAHTHPQKREIFISNSAFIYMVSMVLLCQSPSVLSRRQSSLRCAYPQPGSFIDWTNCEREEMSLIEDDTFS